MSVFAKVTPKRTDWMLLKLTMYHCDFSCEIFFSFVFHCFFPFQCLQIFSLQFQFLVFFCLCFS